MKKRLLSLLLLLLFPVMLLSGCAKDKAPNQISMTRYFSGASYTTKKSSGSVTSSVDNFVSMPELDAYTNILLEGNTAWLYGMTIEYLYFDILATQSGKVEIEIKLTNLTRGSNEESLDSEKYFDKTFEWTVEANTIKRVKIEISDVVNAIESSTKLEFIFIAAPSETYAIGNIILTGYHKA